MAARDCQRAAGVGRAGGDAGRESDPLSICSAAARLSPDTAEEFGSLNQPVERAILDCQINTHTGATTMRFIVMVKATKDSEAGVMPSEELLTAMMKYNEELVKAGIMLAGEGLHPSSKGARVRFSGDKRMVIDGPFAETKELVAGFWLWQCKSKEEAIAWLKRCPNPMPGQEAEIEIRQIFAPEDFGAAMTPELREQEDRLRAQAEKLKK
jgi:hypothetical protein